MRPTADTHSTTAGGGRGGGEEEEEEEKERAENVHIPGSSFQVSHVKLNTAVQKQ